jgi:P27 family predicted phage terminase small subunit
VTQRSGRSLAANGENKMPFPRKSLEKHALTGTTPSYRPEDARRFVDSAPRIPSDVNRKHYKRLCAMLRGRRALTAADRDILRLAAISLEIHERAWAAIRAEGEIIAQSKCSPKGDLYTVTAVNPRMKVLDQSGKMLLWCLQQLGLTPLLKSKVTPTSPSGPPPLSDYDRIMQRRSIVNGPVSAG